MNLKPLYEHDCPQCKFLGSVRVPIQAFEVADMYKCEHQYVLRFSSEPSDNRSGTHETLAFWFRTEKEVFNKEVA